MIIWLLGYEAMLNLLEKFIKQRAPCNHRDHVSVAGLLQTDLQKEKKGLEELN